VKLAFTFLVSTGLTDDVTSLLLLQMQSRLKELQGEFAEEQAKKRNLELQLDTARANVLSLEALREVSCP